MNSLRSIIGVDPGGINIRAGKVVGENIVQIVKGGLKLLS